jgi:hypothetical protein
MKHTVNPELADFVARRMFVYIALVCFACSLHLSLFSPHYNATYHSKALAFVCAHRTYLLD